jgi:predicted nucleotidyltransferase component of viral defense system
VAFAEAYERQVRLLVRALPLIMDDERLALKGGTAINLFIRDLPRLSVDIDLVWLPIQPRDVALAEIDAAMREAADRVRGGINGSLVEPGRDNGIVTKLNVREPGGVQIKVEINTVTRGYVFAPETRPVTPAVEDRFGFAEVRVASFADLYGGKLVAALDRQHPRDLFDVRDLLAAEGVPDDLRRAFLVLLMSHNRPLHEVLAPVRRDLSTTYDREFAGMTDVEVPLADLEATREHLINLVVGQTPDAHRRLLLGFNAGLPDWSLLGIDHVPTLPGVLWKQRNLDSLDAERRRGLTDKLAEVWRG